MMTLLSFFLVSMPLNLAPVHTANAIAADCHEACNAYYGKHSRIHVRACERECVTTPSAWIYAP